MKLFTRSGFVSAMLAGAFAFLGVAPAPAQTVNYSPRVIPLQVVQTFRKTVNFNDANIATGVKFGALPQGAYLISVRCFIVTAFNAGTTNSLAIGTTAAGSDILAGGTTGGTNCVAGTAGEQALTSAVGLGVTPYAGTPTGSNGGFDMFARFTQTGTAATAGKVIFIINYIPDNDK